MAKPPSLKCLKRVGPTDNWLSIYGVAEHFVYKMYAEHFCTKDIFASNAFLYSTLFSMVLKAGLEHFAMQNYVQSPKERMFYLNIFME